MDRRGLDLILQEGETHETEFKEGLEGVDRELTAFANSSGGRILLGVRDDGTIKGLNITNKLKSQVQDIANNCEPKVKIFLESLGNILAIHVREGEDKPYKCSSGFYKRIGPNSQKLSRNEIMELFKSEGRVRFDEMIEPKFKYPDDFDFGRFRRFLELAGISRTGDTEKMLISLRVAEKQGEKLAFNNAGVLFFAKDPQHFIPWSVYTVALFKDERGVDVIDRKEIDGGLVEIVEEVMKFVVLYSKVAYRFTGRPQRENIYEYPFEALREAVINSVMHKYYFEHGHNNILRFLPDRIRMENYWIKPENFVLGKTVYRRNPLIADLFARIQFGEKMGTGFERIKEICSKENAPNPQIEYSDNYFYVVFRQSNEYLKQSRSEPAKPLKDAGKTPQKKTVEKTIGGGQISGQKGGQIISEKQGAILKLIKETPTISRKELSRVLNINPSAIQKHIEKLKQKRLLKRIGPDKGGQWKIIQ